MAVHPIIKTYSATELLRSISPINALLSKIFSDSIKVDLSAELLCGCIARVEEAIVGCGFTYVRDMQQGERRFTAAIVGGVAVAPDWQGQGLSKQLLAALEVKQRSCDINYSFLFAFRPQIYYSSGYADLTTPIRYYDKAQKQWNQFIYRGGMIKTLSGEPLSGDEVIDFRGCVY